MASKRDRRFMLRLFLSWANFSRITDSGGNQLHYLLFRRLCQRKQPDRDRKVTPPLVESLLEYW